MSKQLTYLIVIAIFVTAGVPARSEVKVAFVPGGEPKPNELLVLTEAKLFESKEIELLDRLEVDKVLAEQKLSGMFSADNAVALGQILKTDMFAILETTSVVIFDAKTGLRFVDETLPEKLEDAVNIAADAVKTAIEKRQKLADGTLVTFGVLEVRNADFPRGRDAWCRAVAGMLERSLLHRGGAVLERSRLQHVTRERQLTGDDTNKLLASMKLVDLEFTRGENSESFKLTARIGNDRFISESAFDKPLDAAQDIARMLLGSKVEDDGKVITEIEAAALRKAESLRYQRESSFLRALGRNETALELAEVAYALDTSGKKVLCDCLHSIAYQMTGPPLLPGERFVQPTQEEIHEIVRITTRIIDLLETPPLINNFHSFCFIRERFVLFEGWQPECREMMWAFHHRAINCWYRTSYDTNTIKTNDPVKNFANAVSKVPARAHNAQAGTTTFVRNVGSPYPLPRYAAYNADMYELVFPSLIQLFHQIPEENRDKISATTRTAFKKLLEQFVDEAIAIRNTPPDTFDANAWQSYQRVIGMLSESSNAAISNYAWLAGNKPAHSRPGMEKANDYFQSLKERIEEHPSIHQVHDIEILYEEMEKIIPDCVAIRPKQMTQEENLLAFPYYAEIMAIAIRREEDGIIPQPSGNFVNQWRLRSHTLMNSDVARVQQSYQRTVEIVENLPNAEIRNYVLNANNVQALGLPSMERANDQFRRLAQRIKEHPPVSEAREIETLYNEIMEIVPLCVAAQPTRMTLGECLLALPYYAEIMTISIQRKEDGIIPKPTTTFFNHVGFYSRRIDSILKTDTTSFPLDTKVRLAKMLEECLALFEQTSPENHAKLKSLFDGSPLPDWVPRLEGQPLMSARKPWSEEIRLVSHESVLPVIFCPLVRGKTLYYFTSMPNDSIRLDSMNLDTFQITEGRSYYYQRGIKYFLPYQDALLYDFLTRLPHGCVDEQNVYLVGRNRIHIFPLNGDDPWTFGTEDGLPAGPTGSLCSFNGKLYTAVGTKVVWFVEIDLETKTFEILSSTTAKEGKAPFVNTAGAPEFNCFFADKVRDKLLFFVSQPFGGVWSMDKTGTFTHHLRRDWFKPNRLQVLDENRIFVSGAQFAEIFDLSDLTEERVPELIAGSISRRPYNKYSSVRPLTGIKPNPRMGQLAFFQNALWGNIRNPKTSGFIDAPSVTWERWSLGEDSTRQILPIPENFKNLTMIVPLPNDKGLLVGDGHSIVLLRFEPQTTDDSEQ